MDFLSLQDVDLSGKRVLIRADLNVPISAQGEVRDETRIRASLPAIEQALSAGAAQVIVISHLGRPVPGVWEQRYSLSPVWRCLSHLLPAKVSFQKDWLGESIACEPGEVVLLENCRFNVGEQDSDDLLAQTISSLCDVFVNDAFGCAHRRDVTVCGVAEKAPVAVAGPLLAAELEALSCAFERPKRPLVAIVGGSKVSTKLGILESLAHQVDCLVVGGGIANTFLLAKGIEIGASLSEPNQIEVARRVMQVLESKGSQLFLPSDVVCAKACASDAVTQLRQVNEGVLPGEMILDFGAQSLLQLSKIIQSAGAIIWNGPLGVFELEPFKQGTLALTEAISCSDAFCVAGGGDTLAAIAQFGQQSEIDYVSTGGGAFLEFLEGGASALPAVQALQCHVRQSS